MEKRAIVHVEIASKDPEASAKFYQNLFGWDVRTSPPPISYTMFTAGNNLGGGFPSIDEQMYKAGDVIVYLSSDDIEADLKRVEAAGGKALTPSMEIPGTGWFAFFADPTGNRLAFYKAMPGQQPS